MKRSKTQIKLLQGARRLFWKYGFRRVTVEEICQEAGVSKMSFYRSFENKFSIAKAVFDEEIESGMVEYQAVMDGEQDFVEKMEAIIRLKLKHSDQIGAEFLHDLMVHGGEEFRRYLTGKRQESAEMVMAFFKKGQADGDIRKDLDLDLIPFFAENLTSLASNEQLLQRYDSPGALIREITTFFFYGIVSHPRHP